MKMGLLLRGPIFFDYKLKMNLFGISGYPEIGKSKGYTNVA